MERNPVDSGYSPVIVKRDSVIAQAAKEICRFIDGKGLRAGDVLPPETRLSEMLAISRNSVREALRMLHGLGVVEKASGRGAAATACSTAGYGFADETALLEAAPVAHEVRALAMQKCAELAAVRLTDAALREMESALTALQSAVEREDRTGVKRAHEVFYGLILGGARNPLLASIFRQADSARLTNVTEADNTFLSRRHMAQHRAVLQALLDRDPAGAVKAVRRHFQSLRPMIDLVASRSLTARAAPRLIRKAPRKAS